MIKKFASWKGSVCMLAILARCKYQRYLDQRRRPAQLVDRRERKGWAGKLQAEMEASPMPESMAGFKCRPVGAGKANTSLALAGRQWAGSVGAALQWRCH